MHVEVILLVTAPNLRVRGDAHFLLLDEGGPLCLPTFLVHDGILCHTAAAELLHRYTGLTALVNGRGWIPLKQVGVFDKPDRCVDQRVIAIGYGCIIPETTVLKEPAVWLTVGQINERKPLAADHLEILSYIARNL